MPFKNFEKAQPKQRTAKEISNTLKAVGEQDCPDCRHAKRCQAREKIVKHYTTASTLDVEWLAPNGYCRHAR